MARKLPEVRYEGTAVELLSNLLKRPGAVLARFGTWWVQQMRSAFRTQGRGKPWAPRRVPNYPGALRDLEGGPNIKGRRFDERPALIDTGRLRDSIAWRFLGPARIEGGTTVPYASLQQLGGISTVRITETMRANLAKWLKRRGKKDPEARRSWGWLFNRKGGGIRTEQLFRVTARPFVEFLARDRAQLMLYWRAAVKAAGSGREGMQP